MEIIVVTAVVSIILSIAYVVFGREQDIKREKANKERRRVGDYYKSEINRIKDIKLAGIGSDCNSDYEFSKAMKKTELSDSVRMKIYD